MEIERREFLKLFGGAGGAMLLGHCGFDDFLEIPQSFVEKAKHGPHVETWQNTICGLCPAGCGIRVRLIDGIPVYVKGNPVSPVNRGGLCPLGLNALHSLYHPDRLKGPVRRKGKAEEGLWDSVSWEDALKEISDHLIQLRTSGKSHQVVFLGHEENGLMKEHISCFMHSYGSPNYYQFSSAQNNSVPFALLQGHSKLPAYDILNARLVVSFGANFLEEGYSPIYYTKLYSHHEEQQTRYIQIESRLSLTAANADQWIPIRPGTYGALALGLAYVLIREGLYDREFVRQRTFGFEDRIDSTGTKHLGFKNVVLGNYYPEQVERLTGVPSSVILKLARDIGNTRPSVVISDQGAIDNTNGTFGTMAVHSLNALLGNFEKDGGIFFVDDPPFDRSVHLSQDALAMEGTRRAPVGLSRGKAFPLTQFSIEALVKNVLSETPYPVSALFIRGGNPVFQSLNRRELTRALQKIPLVVSFDSILGETSEYAHLVLPELHFMERWDEVSNVGTVGFTHTDLRHPVVSPLHDSKHCGDVLIQLARRIGGTVSDSFPFQEYEGELRNAVQGIYKSGLGAIASAGGGTVWIQYLQQRGWQIGQYSSFEEFWERLIGQGGWWNPIRKKRRWDEVFQTPSEKFEFYSQKLKKTIDQLSNEGGNASPEDREIVLNQLNITARGDHIFMPHHEPVPYDADMPLYLITFRVLPVRDGEGASLPMMQEMFGHALHLHWQSWAEIHPDTADQFHIRDGEWIFVQSEVGKVRVQAKISQGIMPNVVAIPFGLGHTSSGRYAKGHGVNPNSIMMNLYDMISGKPALQGTKVRISPAT